MKARRLCWLAIAGSLFASTVFGETVRFAAFGDYGTNDLREQSVADLVTGFAVDFIVTTGDNSYGSTPIDDNIGKYYESFIGAYNGSYGPGADTNAFFPSLGNHDYTDGGGVTAYLSYFSLPGNGIWQLRK